MSNSSIVEKVRVTRLRPPEPTPKERDAWQHFLAMAEELQGNSKEMSPLVRAELDRLVAKGNPLAIRLNERISAAEFKPRAADDKPLPPPPARRISRLQWGRPDKKQPSGGK